MFDFRKLAGMKRKFYDGERKQVVTRYNGGRFTGMLRNV